MKNLMIAAVLSLGTMTAFAQEENAVEEAGTAVEETATEATEAVEETATDAVDAETTDAVEATQGDFAEVGADELPESVTAAVSKNYPTASIDKAYVNEANQYKLEVSLEDGTAGTLYADENGNWIEM
ncbi:hypothetical protein [Pricia sp.]|uniref:hypothetical protein n=1 Tax=Pricia sp. TaxID=2268138 RepID=UPI003593E41A